MTEFKFIQLEVGESGNSLGLYMYEVGEEKIDDIPDKIEEIIHFTKQKGLSYKRLDEILYNLLDVHRIYPEIIKVISYEI